MTDAQIAGMTLAALLLICLIVSGLIVVVRRSRHTRAGRIAARRRHPSRSRLAAGLEYPVQVPPRHPERFPELDVHDVHLAVLLDELWPQEEYLAVIDCLHPELASYATAQLAHRDTDCTRRSRIRACRCGGYHIHYRRRRLARPRARR